MDPYILILVAGLVLLGGLIWFTRSRAGGGEEVAQLREDKARLEAELAAAREKLAMGDNIREQIEKDLKLATNELLRQSTDALVKRNEEALTGQAKENQAKFETLTGPIKELMKTYQDRLDLMDKSRQRDQSALKQQLETLAQDNLRLNTTTANLVNALKSAPKTRGRWGEQQLKRVLEMAGMLEHVDFNTEVHTEEDGQRLRPDAVLHLPGDRCVVIDAKTPMEAFLDAVEEDRSDEEREAALARHANQLRAHAMQLGQKSYQAAFDKAPDFVIMFIPGDNFFAAAFERDPGLFEDAYEKNVIVCTPTNLLALARSMAFGWRQERATKQAEEVTKLGNDLYKRLTRLGANIAALSKSLDTTVKRHNDLIGSLEGSVLPQGRKFGALLGKQDDLGDAPLVETSIREAKQGRDLKLVETDPAPEQTKEQ